MTAIAPASLTWFARHELMLNWRHWLSIMAGGRPNKDRAVKIGLSIFGVMLHGLAYAILKPSLESGVTPDKATLITLMGTLALSFSMMLSQAMESVTRAFYTRDDLDLILSSPASSARLFAVRMAASALSIAAMTCLLAAPVINVTAMLDGPHWLAAYLVLATLAAFATALAVLITICLFKYVGARRTRLIAQIVAAVIGAAFLIGIQVAAILSLGSFSRFELFSSQAVVAMAPPADSLIWWPAYALMGDPFAVISLCIICIAILAAVITSTAASFGEHVLAAAGLSQSRITQAHQRITFRHASPRHALRVKEWTLLARDPWLASQTLMQILYLIPPAVMLWSSFGQHTQVQVILAPVLVMAIGQLAGGLAWLAVSGEDAPDLVMTAPVSRLMLTLAKIESVMTVIAVVALPFIVAMAFLSVWSAFATACGVIVSAVSAIAIQFWFRTQSRRSNFRRRQTASRAATFAEAFSSISWAATTGLAAAGSGGAIVFGIFGGLVLLVAWFISPQPE